MQFVWVEGEILYICQLGSDRLLFFFAEHSFPAQISQRSTRPGSIRGLVLLAIYCRLFSFPHLLFVALFCRESALQKN